MCGFNLRWGSLDGFEHSSKNILCSHMEEGIPLISSNVHPKAFSCSLNTLSRSSSWEGVRDEDIITGFRCSKSKKAYFKEVGNGLSSKEGSKEKVGGVGSSSSKYKSSTPRR